MPIFVGPPIAPGGAGTLADTELPDPAAPTDADANTAAPAVVSRMQAFTAGAWIKFPLVSNVAVASDPGVPVHIASSPTLITQPAPAYAAAATPATDANAAIVRLAGITSEPIGESSYGLDAVAYQGGPWVVGQGGGGDPTRQGWIVQGTDTINAERLATATAQTDGSQIAVVRGGAKGTTIAANVTSTDQGSDNTALDAQLYHGGSAVDPREIYTGSPAAIVAETNAVWVREARRPSFTAYSPATAPGNNKSMLSLAFSGTGRIVLREVFIQNVQIASVTGVALYFELHRFTTHSGGTDLSGNIMSHRTADTLPAGTTVRTGATILGDNANFMRRWIWSSDEVVAGATKFETIAAAFSNLLGSLGYGDPLIRRPSIASGEGLHVVCTTNTTIGTFDVGFVFTQE